MQVPTVERAALRIAEHARAHGLAEVEICLHGGEPLLAGPHRIEQILDRLEAVLGPVTGTRLAVQTNGVLLDRDWLDLFARRAVAVSVSIDGDAQTHDRHRRTRRGLDSHAAVRDALRLLDSPRHRPVYAGLIAVIDVTADPAAFLDALFEHHPPRADLLLPHATWADPPPPAGDWLVAAFDHWYAHRPLVPLRSFDALLDLLLGGGPGCELLGLDPLGYAIIDTDGAYRQTEALHAAYDGAAATGLSVFDTSIDELLRHPGYAARQSGLDGLADQCRACDLVRVCGGGHYAHRYRPGHGFANASVYCEDLQQLIEHAARRVEQDLRRAAPAGGADGEAPR
jgi:uncharacterized protein